MPKGDDAIRRKKNKANRKKLQSNDSVKVSNRIAAIIAAKKRRKSGKRSMCQGMCFSLPTPENPFNDKELNVDCGRKEERMEIKKVRPLKADQKMSSNSNGVAPKKRTPDGDHAKVDYRETKRARVKNREIEQAIPPTSIDSLRQKEAMMLRKAKIHQIRKYDIAHAQQENAFEYQDCPSKFLILCLNSIDNALRCDGTFTSGEDQPLFVNTWGVEFWKCYSMGTNILETSGTYSSIEQIAWMTSTAADTIVRKEKEGVSFTSPFLLFIVSSQQKASKVRSVCKPLKALGIHTVSLHPGASIEHQIHGLKSCEPEFLVSTPDRLLELVSLKAVDISGVSLLVVDGLESSYKGVHFDDIKSIRRHISGDPRTVVFNGGLSCASIPIVQNLLPNPVCRLSLDDSVASRSACIIQSIHICGSEEEKLAKGVQVLDEACGSQLGAWSSKVMFVVGKDGNDEELVLAIKSKGYSILTHAVPSSSEVESRKMPAVSVMDMQHATDADLSDYELVIVSNFELPMDNYIQILTGMARSTVDGKLHTLLTCKDAMVAAAPLVEILEHCGQEVPDALKRLCNTAASSL